ncbi:MAG: hypothetical protein DHS20C05_10440 [Hyphococcus sp.]|nr:MAG: hypothetical protein DHS20C05_10440 [Marinicaulis sp.]
MKRSIYSVIAGLVLAASALFLVYNSRTAIQPVEAAPMVVPTTTVLVTTEAIAFGQPIKADFVKEVSWPEDAVPEGIIQDRAMLNNGDQGVRIAIRSFVAGEPLLKSKVSGFGEKPTLSRKVSDELRAFSIRINDVSGVAGFLLPGDAVDIQLTRQIGRNKKNLVTDVIIQNVSVLGIDQLASEETENPVVARTATVEVTPEQAQKLALAQQLGSLSLMLRNYTDVADAEVKRVTVGDLTNDGPKKAAKNDGIYVRVRKGTDVKSTRVPK